MVNIIRIVSKYLILVFMALYVWKCFSYFTTSDRHKRRSNLNRQAFLIFAIHGLCHICMYLNTQDVKLFLYYGIEILIATLYMSVFHLAYKHASRLLTNNIVFLMLIGYTMIYRLSPKLAERQFVLATVGLFLTSFIPFIMMKLPDMRKWYKIYAIIGIAMLLLVFVPHVGKEVYGSRNWINIGGLSLQPMEFVKIIYILYVASALVKLDTFKELFLNACTAAVFCGILVIEKDFGAMLIFYICYILMVYLATSRPIFLIGGIALIVGGIAGMYVLFKDTSFFSHILIRVQAWKDPFSSGIRRLKKI